MAWTQTLVLCATLLLAGCSQGPSQGPLDEDGIQIAHVHGLAYDPGTSALYVATHHGLARGDLRDGTWHWAWVGPERDDLMGFIQDWGRPGVFYSSGHPSDPRAFGGTNLGLRRSMDGGQTWESRSLRGAVDFHLLAALPGEGRLAGVWQGVLKVSQDGGATWTDRPLPPGTTALAATSEAILAANASGLHRSVDGGASWQPAPGLAGQAIALAASRDGSRLLAQVAQDRLAPVQVSLDGGATWRTVAEPRLANAASQAAFAWDPANGMHAFAGLVGGALFESVDGGATWVALRG